MRFSTDPFYVLSLPSSPSPVKRPCSPRPAASPLPSLASTACRTIRPWLESSLARVPLLLSSTTLWHNVCDSFQKHSGQQFVARDFEFNHWFSSKIGLRTLLQPVAKWMTRMQVDTQKRAHMLSTSQQRQVVFDLCASKHQTCRSATKSHLHPSQASTMMALSMAQGLS